MPTSSNPKDTTTPTTANASADFCSTKDSGPPGSEADPPETADHEVDDWPDRWRVAAATTLARRTEKAAARREAAERRHHGMTLRHAWRQTRQDARDARP